MLATLDIEIYEKNDGWMQARYLVHGLDDVLWTDDVDCALEFLRQSCKRLEEIKNPDIAK